jgi:hypothetical protein
MESELEEKLEKGWRSTTRVVFGRELPDLGDYSVWLSEYNAAPAKRQSRLSGKEVVLANSNYPKNARFLSEKEATVNKDYALSINQVKDIDSLLAALSEKCEYAGNRFLGNTAFVESSDSITDSQYVFGSTNVEKSSIIFNEFMIRKDSKFGFGGGWYAASEFIIRCVGAHTIKRSFESHYTVKSSDMHFCFGCVGSHDLLFSFGQRNSSYKIGNLQLGKAEYGELKGKLMSEVVDEIEKEKSFPSLFSLVPNMPAKPLPSISPSIPKDKKDLGAINKGFAKAYNIIFKRQPKHNLDDYGGWLTVNSFPVETLPTPFGGKTTRAVNFGWMSTIPKHRLVNIFELLELGKIPIPQEKLSSLKSALSWVSGNFFFTGEFYDGENSNVNETPCAYGAVNSYRAFDATAAENVAYAAIALDAKYVYGGNFLLESDFCINCFNSNHLTRCLEMDFCTKCADCYFCHNCEGLTDCMFCFNMKGARFCIGNTRLSREDYIAARDAILARLSSELDRNKKLGISIFSIGSM